MRQGVQDVLDDKPTLLTAEQVTEVSGRGVGMSAAHRATIFREFIGEVL